uniref:BIRD-IDD transcription factor fourth C2HC zinc finger domain-containing protein n=1 Tax=Aegilops tauschii TaxID=37682 RepID=R7WDJ3_AEGTA
MDIEEQKDTFEEEKYSILKRCKDGNGPTRPWPWTWPSWSQGQFMRPRVDPFLKCQWPCWPDGYIGSAQILVVIYYRRIASKKYTIADPDAEVIALSPKTLMATNRRDSFITHRAFCDALAEESAKARAPPPEDGSSGAAAPQAPPPAAPVPLQQLPPAPAPAPAPQQHEEQEREIGAAPEPVVQYTPPAPLMPSPPSVNGANVSASTSSVAATSQSLLGSMFAPSSVAQTAQYPERALAAKPPCCASRRRRVRPVLGPYG